MISKCLINEKDESNWYGCTDLSNRATFSDYWKNWSRSFSFDILIMIPQAVMYANKFYVMYGVQTIRPLMAHLNAIEFWLKEYLNHFCQKNKCSMLK